MGQGVVAWDVEVTNQDGDVVASYDILTLVAKRGAPRGREARGLIAPSRENPPGRGGGPS